MSQVKVPIVPNGFSNSRKTVGYDPLLIFRHSIVLRFGMQVYLLSSTLLSVMFCNTHSICADIIWAEIFEPNLSNSIPDSSHIFMRFCALLAIPTFSEPSVRVPCAILQPCFQILRSITLALNVSNCLLLSCCIMIRDIASHAPSICSFRVFVFVLCATLT